MIYFTMHFSLTSDSKELTWRDVQHLIAMSSDNKMKVKENDWIKNGAGFKGTK